MVECTKLFVCFINTEVSYAKTLLTICRKTSKFHVALKVPGERSKCTYFVKISKFLFVSVLVSAAGVNVSLK